MDFLFFYKKSCFSFTKSIKVTKKLEKRYDTNKATLKKFPSHAEVVQCLVCPPLEAFKAWILSGMLSIKVFQNQLYLFAAKPHLDRQFYQLIFCD